MPTMSLAVVMKGPVARAGSKFILFMKMGIVEPTKAAKQTTINRAPPLVTAMLRSPLRYQVIPTSRTAQIKPFRKPTLSSLVKRTNRSEV